MKCKNCGAELQKGEMYCSQCGTKTSNTQNKIIIGLVILLCVIIMVGAGIVLIREYGGKNSSDKNGTVTDQEKTSSHITYLMQETASGNMLQGVKVEISEKKDGTAGTVLYEAESDENGKAEFELPDGEYAVTWSKDNYYNGTEDLSVTGEDMSITRRIVGPVANDKIYILVEWSADTDIDCSLFNAATQEVVDINNPKDSMDTFLYNDGSGSDGYEVFSVNYMKNNNVYTLYIKDYSGFHENSNTDIAGDQVRISVYNYKGLIYTLDSSSEQNTTIWNPIYIYQGNVELADVNVSDISQYPWLANDKKNPTENIQTSSSEESKQEETVQEATVQEEPINTRKTYKEVFGEILRDQSTYKSYYTSHSISCAPYVYADSYDDGGVLYFTVLDLDNDGNKELLIAKNSQILNVLSYDEQSGIVLDQFSVFDAVASDDGGLMDELHFTENGYAYSTNDVSDLYTIYWQISSNSTFWEGWLRYPEDGVVGSDGSYYEYDDFEELIGKDIMMKWYIATESNIRTVLQ